MNNSKGIFSIRSLVQIAMMAAIVFITTYIVKIPSPSGTGYVNVGDAMVFASAVFLGGKRGAIAAGIGGFLSDALGGYLIYAPFTFLIKAGMALIVGAVIYKFGKEDKNIMPHIFGFVLGGIFEVVAYFGVGIIVYSLTVSANLHVAITQSILDIPGNIVQAAVGAVIAVPFAALLGKVGMTFNNKSFVK